LLARLERLESRTALVHPVKTKVRFGNLRRLPQDYQGERHVIVAKCLPSEGKDRVEFEEVAGPDPSPPQELKHDDLRAPLPRIPVRSLSARGSLLEPFI
jgi:hypothetical protein